MKAEIFEISIKSLLEWKIYADTLVMSQYEFLMQFWKGKRKREDIHMLARSYQRLKIDMVLLPYSRVRVMGFCKP